MSQDIKKLIVDVLVRLARFLVAAYFVMFAFGMVHRDAPVIPPLGFLASVSIVLAVSVLTGIAAISWKEAK